MDENNDNKDWSTSYRYQFAVGANGGVLPIFFIKNVFKINF